MMTYPKITVVTVTYNAKNDLEKTIQSILSQDYPNIEYIIIDGASTDGTVDIIKKYESHLAYWVSEPDRGIYDAMNKGIDKSTGEWINFMNAGDIFTLTDTLNTLMCKTSINISLIYGGVNVVDESGKMLTYNPPKPLETICKEMPCCHQAIVIKTDVMQMYRYNTQYLINSDIDFLLRLHHDQHPYRFVDIPVVDFLDNGFHTRNIPNAYLEILYINSHYLDDSMQIYHNSAYHRLVTHAPLTQESKRQQNITVCAQMNRLLEIVQNLQNDGKIVLYGYNAIAKVIVKQLANVSFIVDRTKNIPDERVFSPMVLNTETYDKVIICLLGREDEITGYLQKEFGVPLSKIVTISL